MLIRGHDADIDEAEPHEAQLLFKYVLYRP